MTKCRGNACSTQPTDSGSNLVAPKTSLFTHYKIIQPILSQAAQLLGIFFWDRKEGADKEHPINVGTQVT